MNIISSSHNSVIKDIKALKQRKYREEKKLFFIEGIRFVEEALREKADIVKVLVSDKFTRTSGAEDILSMINAGGYETLMLSDKLFLEISDTENPQGILAVIKARSYALDEILVPDNFLVILESLQDPGNMGTIIRTADAAGATGIIISKGCVDIYNPKVLRSTMGAVFHVPVYLSDNLTDTIHILKKNGIRICATHLKGSKSHYDISLRNNAAIIIGNEANGISEEIASCADVLVKIPMPGRAESLNASVAAGLLMYEVVRQRISK